MNLLKFWRIIFKKNVHKIHHLFLIFTFIICGCGNGFSNNQADKIFKVYLLDPIPSSVQLIEGQKTNWLDAPTYLIFKINETDLKIIINGYSIISLEDTIQNNSLSIAKDSFGNKLPNPNDLICYKKELKTESTTRNYYILWNAKTQTAYFMK